MRTKTIAVAISTLVVTLCLTREVRAIGGTPCEVSSQCADPCKTGGTCSQGYCTYTGAQPAGKSCPDDGNLHTDDYCDGGACQHLVDCSTYAGDYCSNLYNGPCTVSSCLPGDIDPSSLLNHQVWRCNTRTLSDGSYANFEAGTQPPNICNKAWICQTGQPVRALKYSFQDYKSCKAELDPSAGESKCDGWNIDRCRPNRFVTDCEDPVETLRSITPHTPDKGFCYELVTASMLGIPETSMHGKKPGWIELPGPQYATRMPDGLTPVGPPSGQYVSVMTHAVGGAAGTQPTDYDLPVVILEGFDADNRFGWNNEGWNGLLFPALYGPGGLAYDGYDVVYVGQDDGQQILERYAQGAARAMYAASQGFPEGTGSHYPRVGKVFVFGISEGGLILKMVASAWEACFDPAFQTNLTRCPDWFPPELKSVDPATVIAAGLSGDSPIEGAHAPRSLQTMLRDLKSVSCIDGDHDIPATVLQKANLNLELLLTTKPAREMLIRWTDQGDNVFDANTTASRTFGDTITPIFSRANRYGIGFPNSSFGHGYPERIKLYALSEGAWRTNGVSRSVTNCLSWNDPVGCSGPLPPAQLFNPVNPSSNMFMIAIDIAACSDKKSVYLDPIDIGEGSALAALPRDMAYKMVQRNHGYPGWPANSDGDVIWPGLNGDGICNVNESHLNSLDCGNGPIGEGEAYYFQIESTVANVHFFRAWNFQPTASALGCSGTDANGDRLPDSITPVSTQAECEQIIQNRGTGSSYGGGYGFFDVYWQEKALAHDALVFEYKQMPKSYAFLRSVLDEHMKGDGDGYFDHCKDLSGLPSETEANYATLKDEKWGKGKWKACDACPNDPTSHTAAGCLSATQSTAIWKPTAHLGFPAPCPTAPESLKKPTLCPFGDLPQVVNVTLKDDTGQPMAGVSASEIVATGSCHLLATTGIGSCAPLDAANAPTTWTSTIHADAATDASGATTITIPGAIGDCADLQIQARGRTLAVLAFRNVDFVPRTGLTNQSGVVAASEFNSINSSINRTDREWMDFNCSGSITSTDYNIFSLHQSHKCQP